MSTDTSPPLSSSPPASAAPGPSPASSATAAAGAAQTTVPRPKSGIHAALEYTGIPASWLTKRPKLPSRNWLIFIAVTSSLTGAYIYDRRQCKLIREDYQARVRHLSEEPLDRFALPRKVTVYAAKWPGDEDHERGMKYFRRFVKPILVAAAVDYDMKVGKRSGDLAKYIADRIKAQRRVELGIDPPAENPIPMPQLYVSPEEKRRRELEGGIIIVGRQTFKEFMAGLKRGWTDTPQKVDPEEVLSRELENDGRFDEVETEESTTPIGDLEGEPIPTKTRLAPSNIYSPLRIQPTTTPAAPKSSITGATQTAEDVTPPATIPEMAPLLLVPFTNYIGFTQIPLMLWDWFNQRHHVRAGAEAAYSLIQGASRPITLPAESPSPAPLSTEPEAIATDADAGLDPAAALVTGTDLDFDLDAESYYKSSLSKTESEIESARTTYYAALPAKLETARALARGTREATNEERENPPPTEVELRAERLKKELRWRATVDGWKLIRPMTPVIWDERMRGALRVFVPRDEPEGEGEKRQD